MARKKINRIRTGQSEHRIGFTAVSVRRHVVIVVVIRNIGWFVCILIKLLYKRYCVFYKQSRRNTTSFFKLISVVFWYCSMEGHDLSYWTKRRKIEATVVRDMESLRRRVLESNSTDILSPMSPTGHEADDCDLDEDAVYVDAASD